MTSKAWYKDSSRMSKFATIIIFLALIRSISEPFRLQYYSATALTYEAIKPFLIGGLIAATALLAMTILSYFSRHKLIIATCILTIISLLVVKKLYLIP